jgi:hypothetical protein
MGDEIRNGVDSNRIHPVLLIRFGLHRFDPALELIAWEHDTPAASPALEAYVRADPGHFPLEAPAWMLLSQ